MYRMAVIGDRDSIYGFSALGLDVIDFDRIDDKSEKFKSMCNGDYAVIYVTEQLAKELEREIEHFKEQQLPAIILIPGIKGNTGDGINKVKKSVEQAVGSDILFGSK